MISNKFGKFVTERRKDKGLSLRGMAELIDFSPAYWSDIEKGKRNPPNIDKLREIAEILKLTQDEKEYMIDIASEDRDEIPMDLPEYIKETELARMALRKAKQMDNEDVTERAWKDFIKALDEEEK